MSNPLAVIIRFKGDSDGLAGRFDRARGAWIEDQGEDYERPLFYAVCKTDDGLAVVSVWPTAVAHRAFGQGLHAHIDAVGLPAPERIERMPIRTLGWID
jgi:hypothetical protein